MATKAKAREDGRQTVADNRRARYDYHLGERIEAGIVLVGTEVKSLREGRASLAEAWVKVDESGDAWLMQAHIPEYSHAGTHAQHEPTRRRKLLLHRRQLDELTRQVKAKGATIVPTRLYFKDGYAKVEIALGRGKEAHDKRAATAEREAKIAIQRAMKTR